MRWVNTAWGKKTRFYSPMFHPYTSKEKKIESHNRRNKESGSVVALSLKHKIDYAGEGG